jgi:predicted metal-dependent hydrolase
MPAPLPTQHTLTVGSDTVRYQVRRSSRSKRLRLVITPDKIEAVAPLRMDERKIHRFVAAKSEWVLAKWTDLRERAGGRPERRFVSGAEITYRGREVPLRVEPVDDVPWAELEVREGESFDVRVPREWEDREREAAARRLVMRWLRTRALDDARELTRRHAPTLGVTPKDLKIGDQKTLWGSCAADGTIRLNWRLVTAPRPVFEYVVVHELCHLLERSHGPRFWGHVGRVLPEYEAQRRWLRRHGVSLG